ncbi:GumC family protein [Croceicoccus gelatinilyticus]|uniref:GumC family protein n=1 Tax=Croceicoccus gelatinilyticus TaxID=2835536 RepID=UPI001BCC2EE5|nr:Wzz/FepE/Etk N-terminal domain-containing protein [Croceicoccus gelatinilyticus]MBS7670664.1 AAA family ATPase [Croceicoccus gelatinilyticus]
MHGTRLVVHGASHGSLAEIGSRSIGEADAIDFSESLSFIRRRFKLIAAVFAAVLALGIVITLIMPPSYTARSVVSLESPSPESPGAAASNPDQLPNSALVDTQIEIIESREMATRVAAAAGLLNGQSPNEREDVIDALIDRVSATRSGESYAITIAYEGDSPQEAADRANEFARQFVQWELLSTKERTEESIGAIRERLEELRSQAQADTVALQNYRIRNDLLSTSGASLTEQEISSYNQAVTSARAAAAEDQARLSTARRQLRSGSSGDDVGEALGSNVVSDLRAQESTIAAQVADLSSRYGPNHPALIAAQDQLAEVRQRIQAEIGRVISNLEAKAAVSQQRLSSLSGSLSRARSNLAVSNGALAGLDELQRNAQVSQGLYEAYLASYQQLVAGEGTERPNARILTLSALPSKPSSPNIVINLLLATFAGLGLGLLAGFITDSVDRTIATPRQVEHATGQRYLASIPKLEHKGSGVRYVFEEPRSPFVEAFRSLVTSVELNADGPTKVIAITSPLPQEGKSVTSTSLAQVLSTGHRHTLLIDCDYARRGVSQLMNIADRPGLCEVLEGQAPIEDALLWDGENFAILPITSDSENIESLISGDAFTALLEGLRSRFDNIVLDLPPVLPIASARSVAAKADTTIMLARFGKTPVDALQAAMRLMSGSWISVAGIAITQVDMKRKGRFGREDPYYYFEQYKEYYA